VAGLSASQAGYVLLVQPLVMALASPLAGMLSDRIHPGRVGALGLVLLGVVMLVLSGVGPGTTPARAATLLAAAGLGFALFVSPNINAIMRSADPAHTGMASGLLATMRGLGMCLSLAATGIVLALFAGSGAAMTAGAANTAGLAKLANPDILPALRASFTLAGLTAFGAAWVSWRGTRTHLEDAR